MEEAWKRQRQFAADASRELKTPLTVILSNVGLIAASPELTDPEDKRRIGYIQAEAGRMKELVEELLFLARSDVGRLTAEKTHLDLSFLIESCALTFEPVAFEQGKLMETDVEPDLTVWVLPSRRRLRGCMEERSGQSQAERRKTALSLSFKDNRVMIRQNLI